MTLTGLSRRRPSANTSPHPENIRLPAHHKVA
jgi:hypothetical protein